MKQKPQPARAVAYPPADDYMGCKIEPANDPTGKYFGGTFGDGCDEEGYALYFVKVTFPDQSWVYCVNPWKAKDYIRANIKEHDGSDPTWTALAKTAQD